MMAAWCVLLASREVNYLPPPPQRIQALVVRDPLTETLRRAATVSPPERIAVVISSVGDQIRHESLRTVDLRNILLQPQHKGTAYEVLLALIALENRVPASAPLIFLPTDHVVSDALVMTGSLLDIAGWIGKEAGPVYLLGAVPEGPHDQLGYIVPWHDAPQIPTSVYEFVEKPSTREARKLINSGGLWNTFIFGGTTHAMLQLFSPRFDMQINALRRVLRESPGGPPDAAALEELYKTLAPVDFSHEVLARQTDKLNVVRMPRCGWWPLKAPKLERRAAKPGKAPPSFSGERNDRRR